MANQSNKMISDFTGKPATQSFFTAIATYTTALGPVTTDVKAQVSFAVNRKFLWLWAYERTADGVLYLNVTSDRRIDDPRFHRITQVSANRWNHHVEVRSEATANSDWLHDLIRQGYEFARK
jgi:hypothetical protein